MHKTHSEDRYTTNTPSGASCPLPGGFAISTPTSNCRFGGGNRISTQIAGILSKLRTLGASKLRNRDWVILVNQKKRSSEITYRSQARRAQHLRAQD
jgi:hypothetical protein